MKEPISPPLKLHNCVSRFYTNCQAICTHTYIHDWKFLSSSVGGSEELKHFSAPLIGDCWPTTLGFIIDCCLVIYSSAMFPYCVPNLLGIPKNGNLCHCSGSRSRTWIITATKEWKYGEKSKIQISRVTAIFQTKSGKIRRGWRWHKSDKRISCIYIRYGVVYNTQDTVVQK